MNRRRQIELSADEKAAFLEAARTIILCTIDREGYPHAVAMWFCVIDGMIHMTSFRKAQKVVNVRRNPKSTLLVESGEAYTELKGLMLRCETEVIDDVELCLDVLVGVQARHGGSIDASLRDALRSQAAKRCVLRFRPVRISSWDHSKLGGAY
ncbi:MAG: pyridoxamine 5'-phosphate oxidase family protein [Candidatus Binatia bacterium]